MSTFMETVATIGLGLAAVAIVALAVSRRSQTPQVIQAGASGFANILGIAEAPVTGASYSPVLSYPGSDFSASFGYGS